MNDISNAPHAVEQTLADRLAAYASTLKYEDLPLEVIHQAKRMIVDTLGCGFGGYDSEPGRIARNRASRISSTEPATVLYSGQKTSAELAAFANDVMVRYLDFNDGYIGHGGGHPSDSIAALLAAAEAANASGRELIVAVVLAYEVYCRVVDTWSYRPCGVDQVTVGIIASVVGVARLLRLTRAQMVEAINLAVVANIALRQTRTGNVSHWKGCAYANANRNAIFAAQLAQDGMSGPSPIFEGRYGFFKVVSRETFELGPFGGHDEPFRIMRCHLKQFPLGNYAQTVVSAVLEVRGRIGGDVGAIREVHIGVSHKAVETMASDPEKWHPQNRETADHSIPYTAGVALMYGTINERYFGDQYLHDPGLLNLVRKIKCSASDEANARVKETYLSDVELVMSSGERVSARTQYHRGHPLNPMTDAEIEVKFRTLVGDMLPVARAKALLSQLWTLENMARVSALMEMTQRQP